MKTEKEFGELSIFKERDVEMYRSSDLKNTAIYFTHVEDDKMEEAEAFFELLHFELKGGEHQMYIRFPNEDYYIEMISEYAGGRGIMQRTRGIKNVFAESFRRNYEFFSFGENAMLYAKDLNEFNFMKKVAAYDKGNPFNHPYPNETFLNYPEIVDALKMKYLKLPQSIRTIQYLYKTKDEFYPIFIVIDCPAYNFQYKNHRFRIIQGEIVREYKITNFQRFKDGGTTIITVLDENNIEHKFFSPTSLPQKVLCEKWDDEELIEVTDDERKKIIELLQIELEPVSNEE